MSSIKIEIRQEDVNKIKEICASYNRDPGTMYTSWLSEHFGYRRQRSEYLREQYPCCKNIWGGHFLLILHDAERETSNQHLHGYACYVRALRGSLEVQEELKLQVGQTTPDGKFSCRAEMRWSTRLAPLC